MSDTPRTDSAEALQKQSYNESREFDWPAFLADFDFAREIERELSAATERIPLLIAERDTAKAQADQNWKLRGEFKELLGTDDVGEGVAKVKAWIAYAERLESVGDKFNELVPSNEWAAAKETKP